MLDSIREKIVRRQYEFSKHALDQSIVREITVAELEQAITNRSERRGIATKSQKRT